MTPEERSAAVAQILGDPPDGWRVIAIAAVCDEYAASCVRKAAGLRLIIAPDGPRKSEPSTEGKP